MLAGALVSWALFAYICVLRNMYKMIRRATSRRPSHDFDMRGMVFVFYYTACAWSIFPTVWVLFTLDMIDIHTSELLLVFANFAAKVVYSSSMVYDSFDRMAIR